MSAVLTGTIIGLIVGAAGVLVFAPDARWSRRARAKLGDGPIAIHIETDPRVFPTSRNPGTTAYYFPGAEVPPGPTPWGVSDWHTWAHDLGAEDAEHTRIIVYVQTTRGGVILKRMEIHHKTKAIVTGVVRGPGGLGGGAVASQRVYIDLDVSPVEPILLDDDWEGAPLPSFSFDADGFERFDIAVHASKGWNEWSLSFHFLVDGIEVVKVVDNGGRSFVTVGRTGLPQFATEGDDTWYPVVQQGESPDISPA